MKSCQELRSSGTVAVVGAGPAGATIARLLQTRGFSVKVFERDASPTARNQGGSLDVREDSGQRAIASAGLTEGFQHLSRNEAKAFKMVDSQGVEQPGAGSATHENPGPEIDRGDLRKLLLDSLAPGTVAWGHPLEQIHSEQDGRWRLEIAGQAPTTVDLVIGAEGVGSKVRSLLTPTRPRYTGVSMLAANIQRDLWRHSELADVLGEGSVMFAGGEKTIFVQRCSQDLILLYVSMAVAEDWPKQEGFALEDTKPVLAAIRAAYHDWSPQVMAMLTQVEGAFHRWPTCVMPPDYRWESRPGLTMIGDAAHAMPPFTGKGVNLALLDALELANGLTADPSAEVEAMVSAFEHGMQQRTRKEIGECLEVGRAMYAMNIDFSQ